MSEDKKPTFNKRITYIALALVILIIGAFGYTRFSQKEGEVIWVLNDLDRGLELGLKEEKIVLVYFYANWCEWCVKMDKEAFKDPKVAELISKHFVAVKIDIDVRRDLHDYYHITGVPTFIIFDKKGNFIDKIEGYHKAKGFLALLEFYVEGG
ncbi:MAG: thioredoxin family protein [Candidatus Methanofastidiosia archaeon]